MVLSYFGDVCSCFIHNLPGQSKKEFHGSAKSISRECVQGTFPDPEKEPAWSDRPRLGFPVRETEEGAGQPRQDGCYTAGQHIKLAPTPPREILKVKLNKAATDQKKTGERVHGLGVMWWDELVCARKHLESLDDGRGSWERENPFLESRENGCEKMVEVLKQYIQRGLGIEHTSLFYLEILQI